MTDVRAQGARPRPREAAMLEGAFLRDWRAWSYAKLGFIAILVAFAIAPLGGSALSFIYNGGALWCLIEIARGRFSVPRNAMFLRTAAALYAYVAIMLISAQVNSGMASSWDRVWGLGSFLLFPFAYTLWGIVARADIMRACLLGSAIACFGGLVVAMVEVHGFGGTRAEGGAGNALVFATVLIFAAGNCLAGAARCQGRARFIYAAAFLAGVVAAMYSGSRVPLIVVPIQGAIVWSVYGRRMAIGRRNAVLAGVAAIILLLAGVVASGLPTRFLIALDDVSGLVETSDYETSLGLRIALWRLAVSIWMESPLIGHGAGAIKALIETGLSDNFGISARFGHFHNVFLTALVEGGLFGLAALVAALAFPLVAAIRALRAGTAPDEAARFGAVMLLLYLAGFVVIGLTGLVIRHDIFDATFMIYLIGGLRLVTAALPSGSQEAVSPKSQRTV